MVAAIGHHQPDDYVIATGESHTVAEFVETAFAAAGVADWRSRVEVDASFVRPADAAEQRGDPSKARAALGWAPTVDFAGLVGAMVEADLARLT
jgi:GDPmannose 4,6-dehydratase